MNTRRKSRRLFAASQRGQAAIIALLLMIGAGVTILVYNLATPAILSIERDKKTAEALAQAKAALIGFAAGIDLEVGASRPGDLPCPDMDNDGTADTPCSGGALGRLPWQRLGLPDLRDGDGERLWYAVSSNFKNNPRTPCASPGATGCLNSDARGTITVRDRNGTVINDGSNPDQYTPSGVIAVIIAPGRILHRQGAASAQVRGCTVGVDCDANEKCTASPLTLTPKCDPSNYLDVLTGTEDNAIFTDSSSTDGFINGDVFDASGNLIVNDRIITITYQDVMPLLERRVSKEVLNCLTAYAAANSGRYPWAAPVTDVTPPYGDLLNNRFGRIPDAPMSQTVLGLTSVTTLPIGPLLQTACTATPALCMGSSWPTSAASPACHFATGWWTNWKEQVFYAVSPAYSPRNTFAFILLPASVTLGGITPPAGCPTCVTVNPPSATADKRIAVMAAGRLLTGQSRAIAADKQTQTNYLENENNTPADNIFTQQTSGTTFNDVLLFFQ